MKEGAYNSAIVKKLREQGIFCYKVIDKVHFGVPDIYIQNGNWIESKVIRLQGDKNTMIDVHKKLTDKQKLFIQNLIAARDNVTLCIRFEISIESKVFTYFYQSKFINPFKEFWMSKQEIMLLPTKLSANSILYGCGIRT
jgi:hypothetical protein